MITLEELESDHNESITTSVSFSFKESSAERIKQVKAAAKSKLSTKAKQKVSKKYREAILKVTEELESLFGIAS